MTAHELARKLLEGPDIPVVCAGIEGETRFITEVDHEPAGSYSAPDVKKSNLVWEPYKEEFILIS